MHAKYHLTHILLLHGVQDARGDVGAHPAQGGHLHVRRRCNALRLQQVLLAAAQCLVLLSFVHGDDGTVLDVVLVKIYGESHQAVVDVGVADGDAQLGQHLHVLRVVVGHEAFSVVRTPVLLCLAV